MAVKEIQIAMINDIICPYCYIAHVELQRAITSCQYLPVKFNIQYKPFKLIDSLPGDKPVDKATYYRNKVGEEVLREKAKAIIAWGDQLGLNISFKGGVVSQTTRAHRLCLKAYQIGGQDLQLPLFASISKAFSTDQRDIGDVNVLAELAEESSVMEKDKAIEFLESDELLADVEKMASDAKIVGFKGVPAVVINKKYIILGPQTSEQYSKTFRQIVSGTADVNRMPADTSCH